MKDKFADKLYNYYRLRDDVYKKYKLLSANYVIDENQSVKWNKEEVEKRNQQCKEDLIKSQKEVAEVYKQLLNEILLITRKNILKSLNLLLNLNIFGK